MLKKNLCCLLTAMILVSFSFSSNAAEEPLPYTKIDDGIIVRLRNTRPNGTKMIRLQVVSDRIIRATATPLDSFSTTASLMTVPARKSAIDWDVREEGDRVILKTARLTVGVSTTEGSLSYTDSSGREILSERSLDPRMFRPVMIDGEPSFEISQFFVSPADEALYGLGQHQSGVMNYKNRHVDLTQYNTEVAVPFLVSTRNYGILWDNYSITKVGDSRPYQPLSSLKLYSDKNEEGWLTATYSHKGKPNEIIVQRPESTIDYEFLPSLKFLPKEIDLAKTEVSWSGFLGSSVPGTYQLLVKYGGYTRVWVDDSLVMDRWRQSWNPGTAEIPVSIANGKKNKIKIEWNPDGGESFLAVKCLSPLSDEEKKYYSFRSEAGVQSEYYFIHGENMDDVIAGYRTVTGAAPIMPKWAMGFWQSRERYKTQEEILSTAAEFRRRKIPLDNIVLDWSYWEQDKWGSQEFDLERFPDATGMIKSLHEQFNLRFMISVWPKFYEGIKNYNHFDSAGFLYKRNIANRQRDWIAQGYISTFYDAFNADARERFWKLVNQHLFKKGVDAWWMDATEPDIYSNASIEDRKQLMKPIAEGTSTTYFNAFPLQNAKGIYEGQRATDSSRRVFILTRSAYAGMQRYAAATWSGDIGSRWHDFRDQIPAGVNFSMSGLPYWTMDIGGFAVERRFENAQGADLDEWREMNARWFQYGAFCPLFRSHGQFPFREIYNIAPESHPAYASMLYYNKLRYRLMPYIYSLAGHTYHRGYTIMRGLVMDFPNDNKLRNIDDQYMFGPSLLVNPVTVYKATSRKLYLPSGTGWYNLYDGRFIDGGVEINADAPYERMPLYVREGSIIPVGPDLQYTAEKPADPITLFVYTGRSASFTLYEDEGTNYDYESGKFSEIDFIWNEEKKMLTIGNRRGGFAGMLANRQFRIVFINKDKAVPFNPDQRPQTTVSYKGIQQEVRWRGR